MTTTVMLSSSSIIGNEIKNRAGEDLGSVKEIMFNPTNGDASYAVISFGGFLGLGDKYFAVPFDAMTLDRENKCYILDISKERLKDAPGFSKDHWPNFADPVFRKDIHSYYGARKDYDQN